MTYKYELHSHTSELSPCGRLGVKELIDVHIENGYSGLILTDHFRNDFFTRENLSFQEHIQLFLSSYNFAKEYCEDKDFFVGMGAEIRFNNNINDFLIYGLNEEMLMGSEDWLDLGLEKFYTKYQNNLLIIEAHPHRENASIPDNVEFLHGLEVYNTNPRHNNHNEKTKNLADKHPHLIQTAGSDTHRLEDLGQTGIQTEEKIESDQQFLDVLKTKKFTLIGEGN